MSLRAAIKSLLPPSLRRRIYALRFGPRLREIYYGRQLRAIFPSIAATGEVHNFTYDLTDGWRHMVGRSRRPT